MRKKAVSNQPDLTKIVTIPQITDEMRDFSPSEEERCVVKDVWLKFRMASTERNRAYQFLDGRTLIQFINDSVRRYVTNLDERDDIEDWQARIHDKFTNNKVNAILAKAISILPIASFTPRGDEDPIKTHILNDLYSYSEDIDSYEENMVHILEEAIVKGTAVVYEGVRKHTRLLRDVRGVNDNITVVEHEESITVPFTELVPLEEFYPSHVRIRKISDPNHTGDMPWCFWRQEMPHETFIAKWGDYERAKNVKPWGPFIQGEARPFYADYVSPSTQYGNVELIRFYDQQRDQYVIIANGVWLNPIMSMGKEVVSPLPFNHKMLPFWSFKFSILGDWFYGDSLPNKLKNMQDVLNVLTNMLLDQSFLTIFPPMLTNGVDSIEDDYLRPGRRTPIDTQGMPISQAYMKLDMGTPSNWHQYILEYTRKIMEESSMDRVSQGQAGSGDRVTAQEVRIAAEGVAAVLGLFGRLANHGLKQKAHMRAGNILQFWFDPTQPFIKGLKEDEAQVNKAFNTFKVDNVALTGGKRGVSIIEVYKDKEALPDRGEIKARSAVKKMVTGKEVQIIAIEPSYVRNIDFDVVMEINQRTEQSRELRQAMQMEKVKMYMTFFPNQVNVNELASQTAEIMGDDPTIILQDSVFNPPQQPAQGAPGQQGPQANPAQNMAQSAGGSAASMMGSLGSSMMG